MPPKKKDSKGAAGDAAEGEDPVLLLQNYQKFCKSIGIPINPVISKNLNDEEKYPVEQLLIDDEFGPVGPGGIRALMTAIMGTGPGMKGGAYKLIKSIRIWRSNCSDDGVASIAEVLRLGGSDVKLFYLELLDNNIGPRGANALGASLSYGHNLSLLTLKLDFNQSLGNDGLESLCKGLRTNMTLKQLHMQFCNITAEGGQHIAELLANSRSALEVINFNGNRLGGVGLAALCRGLMVNTKCTTLGLADNMIDHQTEDDLEGIACLRDCLMTPTVNLASVDLLYNRIGEPGAKILLPALGPENTKIKEFLVDLTLPMPIFELIFRKGGGGKKGKKGGKKGGKKK